MENVFLLVLFIENVFCRRSLSPHVSTTAVILMEVYYIESPVFARIAQM